MVLCLNVVNLTIMLCIFFPVSLSVYVGPMQSGISASDSFMILITFSRTFSDFSLTLCLTPSMRRQTLLPYCSNSSTFLSRACFTVLTWFCNKVTCDFRSSISLSFSLSIALTSFIISFFKSETKSSLKMNWVSHQIFCPAHSWHISLEACYDR